MKHILTILSLLLLTSCGVAKYFHLDTSGNLKIDFQAQNDSVNQLINQSCVENVLLDAVAADTAVIASRVVESDCNAMANQFDSIFVRRPRRNKFNLSFQNKLTTKFGQLTPFLVQDVIPGDHFKVGSSHVIRLQPTVAPVMHNVQIYKHYFFVPLRLIWDDWEEFITGGVTGSASPTYPVIEFRDFDDDNTGSLHAGSLADYLGFPTLEQVEDSYRPDGSFDALPFMAYQLIYQEYYRDQNLQAEAIDFPIKGDVISRYRDSLTKLRFRAWKKDEFTSALPWPQRAGQSVALPVNVTSTASLTNVPGIASGINMLDGTSPNAGSGQNVVSLPKSVRPGETQYPHLGVAQGGSDHVAQVDVTKNTRVNVSSTASLANIVELRRAFKVQEWLEAMATGGARYVEQIKRIFGVRTSDGRLQRPLYLGGTSCPLVMEATAQTSQTTTGSNPSVQGNLSGNGASVTSDFVFKNRFEEHGFIIGIMSIVPRASYYQGIPAKYLRQNRFDYYWPQFAHIGEQPILKRRLFFSFDSDSASDTSVFGYQPRYAEYRFNNDEVHGELRTTLKQWHLGRDLSPKVQLNTDFVTVQPEVADNIMAVNSYLAAPFICQINNSILGSRLVSKYGTPHL